MLDVGSNSAVGTESIAKERTINCGRQILVGFQQYSGIAAHFHHNLNLHLMIDLPDYQ